MPLRECFGHRQEAGLANGKLCDPDSPPLLSEGSKFDFVRRFRFHFVLGNPAALTICLNFTAISTILDWSR